jgi:CubicO group peptidase (beta-lactamase class C family)
MKLRLAAWVFFNALLCCKGLNAQVIHTSKATLDSVIMAKMKETGIVGLGASIIIDKELIWSTGYGFSDIENKVPFGSSTVMNIASVSKTFTGVCIMKAVEEGLVSLDVDINKYLPFRVINPNSPDDKITLRHLATHTSGLIDRNPFYGDSTYHYGKSKPEPLGEFLKNYFVKGGTHYDFGNFLNAKPGEKREYSNIGAGLAGYIVEVQTGKSLQSYAKEHIFKPLEMKNSGWALAEIDTLKHSKLYKKQEGNTVPIQWYEVNTYPDGGVRTSVDELSRFFIALLNVGQYHSTRILKEESVKEMLRFQYTASNRPDNVNITKINQGIFWATKMGATRIGHNGSDPGVRTFMLSDLEKEVAVILFFNTSLSEAEEAKFFDFYEEFYAFGKRLKAEKLNNR